MRSLLIALNGQLYCVMLPEEFRYRTYHMTIPSPTVVEFNTWAAPVRMAVRTFEWRGQIVRKNGTPVTDFFEEIEL
jgi:hypothetical protein